MIRSIEDELARRKGDKPAPGGDILPEDEPLSDYDKKVIGADYKLCARTIYRWHREARSKS